jgi:hypothetical protein
MQVEFFQNIFDESVLDQVRAMIKKEDCNWKVQKHFWHDNLIDKSLGVIHVVKLEGELHDLIASQLGKFLKPTEVIKTIQLTEWHQLSQINWHNDHDKTASITIYLNQYWHHDWGGYFCWKESSWHDSSQDFKMIIPRYNSGVMLRGCPHHHVSLVSPFAPARLTIQVWIDTLQTTQNN